MAVKKKKKLKSIAKLVEEAAVILQRIVRLKAADGQGYVQCVTCGIQQPWQDMQGGHFISRVFTAHKLLEENINPQCPRCNGPLRGNQAAYTLFMVDTYGREWVDELLATKSQTKKYLRYEIEEVIDDLKDRETNIRRLKGL